MRIFSALSFCLGLVCFCAGPELGFGQPVRVEAEQGQAPPTPPALQEKDFVSPMILRVPLQFLAEFGRVDNRAPNVKWWTDKLARFVCDGVKIKRLEAVASRSTGSKVVLTLDFFFFTRNGVDKTTRIECEVLDGDKVVARVTPGSIDTEENKEVHRRYTVDFPQAVLEAKEPPVLKITVHVAENP
jgi:hypothetical protein